MKTIEILCPKCGSKSLTAKEPSEVDFVCDLAIPFICKSCGYNGLISVCRRDGSVQVQLK